MRVAPQDSEGATGFLLPLSYDDMDKATLLTVSAMGNHGARIELLKRHIMAVDQCSYFEATKVSAVNDVDRNFEGSEFSKIYAERHLKRLKQKTEKEWLSLHFLTKQEL
jgi:hypothetical protein